MCVCTRRDESKQGHSDPVVTDSTTTHAKGLTLRGLDLRFDRHGPPVYLGKVLGTRSEKTYYIRTSFLSFWGPFGESKGSHRFILRYDFFTPQWVSVCCLLWRLT